MAKKIIEERKESTSRGETAPYLDDNKCHRFLSPFRQCEVNEGIDAISLICLLFWSG